MVASKHGTLAVNGVRLHFVEQGDGAPILFLHGFPEYWGAWRRVMAELGDQFRSVAIDTRGINLSERPARVHGYDMRELVKDVRQAVAMLGYEKVTLVGHDWGGFIAWETAIRHPEVLEGLVIINTAHTGIFDRELRKDGAQAAASKYMLAFRSSRGEELVSRNDFAGFRREIIDPHLASGMMTEGRSRRISRSLAGREESDGGPRLLSCKQEWAAERRRSRTKACAGYRRKSAHFSHLGRQGCLLHPGQCGSYAGGSAKPDGAPLC